MCCEGVVKKMAQPPVKLIHDKYAKALDLREEMTTQLEEAMKCKPELKSCLSRVYDNLDPVRVLGLFETMVEQVCKIQFFFFFFMVNILLLFFQVLCMKVQVVHSMKMCIFFSQNILLSCR
jgi:hypothetical protein